MSQVQQQSGPSTQQQPSGPSIQQQQSGPIIQQQQSGPSTLQQQSGPSIQQNITVQGPPGHPRAAHQSPVEWLPRLKCHCCQYVTNTQNELVYHIETQHQQPTLKCDNCPQSFRDSETLVTHIVKEHTSYHHGRSNVNSGVNSLISAQVNCLDWKCSFCGKVFQGKDSRDNHICNETPFNTVQRHNRRVHNSQAECKRGVHCRYLKEGRCWYQHAQGVERPVETQETSRSTRRGSMWCAYQDKCDRRQTCAFKHMDEETVFLQNILRRSEM